MSEKYRERAQQFKALSDPNRLKIMSMLSSGELCACRILEALKITQPTLSHHMNCLCECRLVNCRRDGKWMYYSQNKETAKDIQKFLEETITDE